MATDNLTSSEKVDVFNKAMAPLESHKKQFQSGKFEGTGMKDETIPASQKVRFHKRKRKKKLQLEKNF